MDVCFWTKLPERFPPEGRKGAEYQTSGRGQEFVAVPENPAAEKALTEWAENLICRFGVHTYSPDL